MRYYFIAPVFNLELPKSLNKGIVIRDKLRISNCESLKDAIKNESNLIKYSGIESWNEIINSPCIYKIGDTEEWKDKSIFTHTFYLLRLSQKFVSTLWEVKDNSTYVRDGFIFSKSGNDKEINELQKGSVSIINSQANGQLVKMRFSEDEIRNGVDKYQDDILDEGNAYFLPSLNPIDKKIDRKSRANMFISIARSNVVLPIKIYNYCTALESIFNTSQSEIAHKIAQRTAIVLSSNYEERVDVFNLIKTAYNIRSKFTHGQPITVSEEKLIGISISLDEFLRRLLSDNILDFLEEIDDKSLDKYYDEIILRVR